MTTFELNFNRANIERRMTQAFSKTVVDANQALQSALKIDSYFPPVGSGDGDLIWTGALATSQKFGLTSQWEAVFLWGGLQTVMYRGKSVQKNVSLYAPIIHEGGSAITFETGSHQAFPPRPWTNVLIPNHGLAKAVGFNLSETFKRHYQNASV